MVSGGGHRHSLPAITTWQLACRRNGGSKMSAVRILGVVVNDVDLDSPHYNSYTYYYYYRSGYTPLEGKDKEKAANA